MRITFRDSPLSRATRAFFAFLFRNALPVDASQSVEADDDITLARQRERALAGAGLVLATTYRPSLETPSRDRVSTLDAAPRRRRPEPTARSLEITRETPVPNPKAPTTAGRTKAGSGRS